jgi:hypothetical protein
MNRNRLVTLFLAGIAMAACSGETFDSTDTADASDQHERIESLTESIGWVLLQEHSLQIDTSHSAAMGYSSTRGMLAGGPQSIALVGDSVFIVDSFHRNVKCLNVATGKLSVVPLPQTLDSPPYQDVVARMGRLYLLNRSTRVTVYDIASKAIDTVGLPSDFFRSEQRFASDGDGNIVVQCLPCGQAVVIGDSAATTLTSWRVGHTDYIDSIAIKDGVTCLHVEGRQQVCFEGSLGQTILMRERDISIVGQRLALVLLDSSRVRVQVFGRI